MTAATILFIIITLTAGIFVFQFYLNGFSEAADEKTMRNAELRYYRRD